MTLSNKRKKLFKEHLESSTNCNPNCIRSIQEQIEIQDREAVNELKKHFDNNHIIDSHENKILTLDMLKRTINKIFGDNYARNK